MSLDQIITVNIDRNTTTPTQVGFGTPLIAAYFPTSVFPERVKAYSSMVEVSGDFESFDPVYKAANAIFSQNPSPPVVKVGRRASPKVQAFTLTPTDFTVGAVYAVRVTGTDDATYASRAATVDYATYTVVGGDTATDVCNGLRTSFGTPSGDFSLGGTTTLTITADNTHATVAGQVFGVEAHAGTPTSSAGTSFASVTMQIVDGTPDAGELAADLAAINTYDPDWYGLCLDSNSAAEILAAAGWVASNEKLLVAQTQDFAVAGTSATADTTSVAALLKSSTRERTMLFFHRNNLEYVGAAMLGRALPETPGSITWAYKQLIGIAAQRLTTDEIINLGGSFNTPGKSVNYVTTLSGVSVTRYGTSSSGEYMDVMRGTDWLAARIQEDVYALLIQNDKVPYTDRGIQAVRGVILGRLQEGVANNFLSDNPEPTCTVPRAADVSAADKGSRTLNNVTFRATLAGAVHKVAIEGELNL